MIEALSPFIVTQCSGTDASDLDAESRAVCSEVELPPGPNPALFVFLDREGMFHAMVNPLDFKRNAGKKGGIPETRLGALDSALLAAIESIAQELGGARKAFSQTRLVLPTVEGAGPFAGVRIWLSIEYPAERAAINYLAPTIEAASVSAEEKAALAWPGAAGRDVESKSLKTWLKQIYPPAIMDSYGNVTKGSGTLRLTPAEDADGMRRAVLSGEVDLVLDDAVSTRYRGTIEGVVLYAQDSEEPIGIRAVYVGRYPKRDQRNQQETQLTLTAVIESLPE